MSGRRRQLSLPIEEPSRPELDDEDNEDCVAFDAVDALLEQVLAEQRPPHRPGLAGADPLWLPEGLVGAMAKRLGVTPHQAAALLVINRLGPLSTDTIIDHIRPQCGPSRRIRSIGQDENPLVPTAEWLHPRLSSLEALELVEGTPGLRLGEWTWRATPRLAEADMVITSERAELACDEVPHWHRRSWIL